MGIRDGEQEELFITHQQHRSQSHPYYQAVNKVLAESGFDRFAEKTCAKFYAKKMGRPSMAPGVYFRCLLLGYFEGIDSERGIAWRAADSLSLRDFLGIAASKVTPDHSTISRTRRLLDLETHQAVFSWVLGVLDGAGLIRGKTLGVDGTTLEANAAMKSIVRRDDGRSYEEFLTDLAKTSGITTPTREDLARMDRKREKKGSNADWYNPYDPEAKISKMKDGSTHLSHKEEHAVDMDTGAVVAVTLDGGTAGDTTTLEGTLAAAEQNLEEAREHAGEDSKRKHEPSEVVADKAEERDAVYANRRRKNGHRGRHLMRLRGEIIERTFAHVLETGGMRRLYLCHQENIAKRLLVHIAGYNLGLLMRKCFGVGKPRCLQGQSAALWAALVTLWNLLASLMRLPGHADRENQLAPIQSPVPWLARAAA